MKNYDIIIWGNDNHNALGLLRQLGKSEYKVLFLINGKKGIASKSKYCKHYIESKGFDNGISILLDGIHHDKKKPLIIPSGDGAAEAIDKNAKELRKFYIFSGTTVEGNLTRIDDKNIMCELAIKHGFNVPKFAKFCKNRNLDWYIFPSIIKPTIIPKGIREFKTKTVDNQKDLDNLKKNLGSESEYQIQEYISKDNDIVVYGVRLLDGEIVLAGQYIKDRWSDDGGGSHGKLTGELPEYLNKQGIKSLLEEIDYYGLFSFEYGLKDNKVYFYEINLRNDATSHLFYQAGINLPLLWANHCLRNNKDNYGQIIKEVWNINEIYDKINIKRKIISKEQYNKDLKEASVFYFYDPEDLEPYKAAKFKGYYDVPLRAMLKKYRPFLAFIINKLLYAK